MRFCTFLVGHGFVRFFRNGHSDLLSRSSIRVVSAAQDLARSTRSEHFALFAVSSTAGLN